MSPAGVAELPLEGSQVGRKPSHKPPPSDKARERARDKGTVTPLGVEISTRIDDALERCRVAKKWSKRVLVEEALTKFLSGEGFPPADPKG